MEYLEFVTNKTLLISKYVFHYLNDNYKNIILLYHVRIPEHTMNRDKIQHSIYCDV